MTRFLTLSPFLVALILGLALGVAAMLSGIDRHLQRKGRISPFNLPTIASFAAVAGAVGYPLARYSSLGIVTVSLIAAASGVAGGIGIFALLASWAVPGAARDVVDPRFILQGHVARVSDHIGLGGSGRISYVHDGSLHNVSAVGIDGQRIESGVDVVIERIEDGVAHVAPWSTIERELELPT